MHKMAALVVSLVIITTSVAHAQILGPNYEDDIIFEEINAEVKLRESRLTSMDALEEIRSTSAKMDEVLQSRVIKESNKVRQIIFNPNDVTIVSNVDPEYLREVLIANNRYEMAKWADSFVKSEEIHGINAWFMAGIGVVESGAFTSPMARSKFNGFGINAVDSNPNKAFRYSSFHDAIMDLGFWLKSGPPKYQHYVAKGKVSIWAIGKTYSSDQGWATKINGQIDYWKRMNVR